MKFLIFCLCCILFLFNCDSQINLDSFVLENTINLQVVDINGNDLLDPKNPRSFEKDKIKIFYLEDGVTKRAFNLHLDYPNFFYIYQTYDTSNYRIRIFLNYNETEEYPVTYVQWNENDTDTLKCHFIFGENFVKWDKVWYNDDYISVDRYKNEKIIILK